MGAKGRSTHFDRSRLLKIAVDCSTDGLCIIDREFNLLLINRQFKGMAGLSPGVPETGVCHEIIPSTLCHTDNCPLVRVLSGNTCFQKELETTWQAGEERACLFTAWPLRNSRGDIRGMVQSIRDMRAVKEVREELLARETDLEEKNRAIDALTDRLQQEKREMTERIGVNVEKNILPLVDSLATELTDAQQKHLHVLRGHLQEMSMPATTWLSNRLSCLTLTEMRICNLIRKGYSNKEIAAIEHISPATVSTHRHHIRRKLKIVNQQVNLATHLNYMSTDT